MAQVADPLFEEFTACSYCGCWLGQNHACFWCRSCAGLPNPEYDLDATPCGQCDQAWGTNPDCMWCEQA